MASTPGSGQEQQCERKEDGILSAVRMNTLLAWKGLILLQISALIGAGPEGLSEANRQTIVDAAYQLQCALETPEEKVFRIMSMVRSPVSTKQN